MNHPSKNMAALVRVIKSTTHYTEYVVGPFEALITTRQKIDPDCGCDTLSQYREKKNQTVTTLFLHTAVSGDFFPPISAPQWLCAALVPPVEKGNEYLRIPVWPGTNKHPVYACRQIRAPHRILGPVLRMPLGIGLLFHLRPGEPGIMNVDDKQQLVMSYGGAEEGR